MTVGLHPEHLPAAGREVAEHRADAVVGHCHAHRENWLQQAGRGGEEAFLEGVVTGHVERDVLGVDRVGFAVEEVHLYVRHAIAGEHALTAGGCDALLHRGHEHAVDVVAHERLGELDAVVARGGFDPHPNLGELTGSAGLLFVPITRFGAAADGLAVRDRRLLQGDLHAETTRQPLHNHLQVDLALPGRDRLVQLVVDAVVERRVLEVQRREAQGEFVLFALGAQLQGGVNIGARVVDFRQTHLEARAAKRVAGVCVAQLNHRAQVAGA